MRFSLQQSDLLAALATVTKALSSKGLSPATEGVLLTAKDDTLTLRCTNSQLLIETKLPVDISQNGIALLPGKLFFEIVRKFNDDLITIEINDAGEKSKAFIKCNSSQTVLHTISADEFPDLPFGELKSSINVKQKLLRDMIRQTSFAAAIDQARPVLTGVFIEANEQELTLVGLDGYRMAVRKEKCTVDKPCTAIVPASSINEIAKVLAEIEDDAILRISDATIETDLGHTLIRSILINGDYINYKQIIPKSKQTCVTLDSHILYIALDRASLMAREGGSNTIKFSIKKDCLEISSNSEMGNVFEPLPISLSGGELEISFNSKYIIDVLKVIDDQSIIMQYNTNITPCVIEPAQGNSFLFLVLPMRTFK